MVVRVPSLQIELLIIFILVATAKRKDMSSTCTPIRNLSELLNANKGG